MCSRPLSSDLPVSGLLKRVSSLFFRFSEKFCATDQIKSDCRHPVPQRAYPIVRDAGWDAVDRQRQRAMRAQGGLLSERLVSGMQTTALLAGTVNRVS